MFPKRRIGFKISFMLLASIFLSIIICTSFMLYQTENITSDLTGTLSDELTLNYDNLIKSEVESVISMLDGVKEEIDSGTITKEEGLRVAADMVRKIRYGKDGYFTIDTEDGVNVVLLGNKKVEGKNRKDAKDAKGFGFMQKILDIGNSDKGCGYLNYYFPKKGSTVAEKKRGYVQKYKPFGWIVVTGNYTDDIDKLIAEKHKHVDDMNKKMITYSLILCAAFLIIGFFISKFLAKSISKPITILQKKLDSLANYNLVPDEKQISYIQNYIKKNSDEVSSCIKSSMIMSDNFSTLIKQIHKNTEDVTATSEELTAISQNTSQSANEVSEAVENIAQGATSQAQDTQGAANNIQVIRDLIKENSNMVNELKNSVNIINEKKENGQNSIEGLIDLVKENNSAAQNINEIIIGANKSADRISTASEMIQSISDQTNLLALNAAIEAARAGEAGKGFAVVAEEIRKLAEQSSGFTSEITQVIEELKKNTQEAVDTMVSIGKMVKTQNDKASETQDNFNQISNAVETSEEIIEKIAKASSKIEENSKKIVTVIENLSAIAQENAATTEEVSAGVSTQTQTIHEVMESAENLSNLAVSSQEAVAKFKF